MSTIKQVITANRHRLIRAPQQPRLDGLEYLAGLPIARALCKERDWDKAGARPEGKPALLRKDEDCYNAWQVAQSLQAGYVVHLYCDDSHPEFSDAALAREA